MTQKAATVCAEPGCPAIAVDHGRCASHARGGSTRRWRRQRARVIARDHGICHICGKPGADSADHLLRVIDGGTDQLENLAAAHLHCNIRRR